MKYLLSILLLAVVSCGHKSPTFRGDFQLKEGAQGTFGSLTVVKMNFKEATFKIPDEYGVPFDSIQVIITENSQPLVNLCYPKHFSDSAIYFKMGTDTLRPEHWEGSGNKDSISPLPCICPDPFSDSVVFPNHSEIKPHKKLKTTMTYTTGLDTSEATYWIIIADTTSPLDKMLKILSDTGGGAEIKQLPVTYWHGMLVSNLDEFLKNQDSCVKYYRAIHEWKQVDFNMLIANWEKYEALCLGALSRKEDSNAFRWNMADSFLVPKRIKDSLKELELNHIKM